MRLVGMRVFPRWFQNVLVGVALALAAALVLSTQALAQDAPTLLVASPELQGPYAGTVLLVAPWRDEHVGVILNRPTELTMAQIFPDHPPSKNVKDPVYFGGPVHSDTVFALTLSAEQPHPKSIYLAPNVWLVLEGAAVDLLMEADPNAQRYVLGAVTWKPGELVEELEEGYFVKRPVDKAKLMRPDTSTLWDELSQKKGQTGT